MIIDISILGASANLSPPHPDRANRILVIHHPGTDVEQMHVLLHIEVTA
jgi:hypothetical protein